MESILDGVLFATAFRTRALPPRGIFRHMETLATLFAVYFFGLIASADSIAVYAMFGTLGMVKAKRIRSTDFATGYVKSARTVFTIR